jgi:predicted PurR-regulated permease PerM
MYRRRMPAMRTLPLLSFVWMLISSSVFAAAGHEPAYPFNVAAMLVFLLAILHTFCRRSDQPARLSAL